MKDTKLAIVIPCFNEEETLQNTINILSTLLDNLINEKTISADSKLLLIDDGSKDNTWNIINKNYNNGKILAIKLAHNAGHQNALFAGLQYTTNKFDITISIDADLQDDIDAIPQMISKYKQGYDIVYGVRCDRRSDTFIKRKTAETFYKLMNFLGSETIYNHADFRLMSNTALNALSKYNESNLYLRGIIPKLGFKSTVVEYKRKKREAGKSKYNIKNMFNLAINGLTSFSEKPLNLLLFFSLIIFILSILSLVIVGILDLTIFTINQIFYIINAIWLVGSLQLLFISIVGIYIGKINIEVKNRPKYIIETILEKK